MGIYQKKGNWYIDYYVQGHRKRKKIGPSKKLAEQVLMDKQVKIAKKEFLGIEEEKKVPFCDYAKEYLEYSKANKSPAMYQRRDVISVGHFKKYFEGYYLSAITPQLIEKFKVWRLQQVSSASVNRDLTCLKHMVTKAMEWGYLKHNPTKGVSLLKEPPGRLRYLELTEIKALLGACSEHLRPIIIIALNTGMRKNEILRLRWSEVDMHHRKILVIQSKNNENRVIPMNQTVYNTLLKLHAKDTSGYVFHNSEGNPYSDVKKGFTAALRRAGINNARFHDLRHTAASYLVMNGIDLRTVQQILGHKDIKMTLRYSHLSPAHVQEAVNTLDSLWTLFGHQEKTKNTAASVTSRLSIMRP